MSSWSDQEVDELQKKGNDYARRTWLKNAPSVGQNRRPREGDNIDVFKRFVVDVYERKRYHGEDEGVTNMVSIPPTHVATALPLSSGRNNRETASKVTASRVPVAPTTTIAPPVSAPKPMPLPAPPVEDLLDFTSMPSTAHQPAVNSNTFQSDFGEIFATASNTAVPAGSFTGVAQIQNHLFQPNFDTAPPNNSVRQSVKTSTAHSFRLTDNKAYGLEAATPTSAAVKKPVMSNHSMCEKSSFISSMNMSAPIGIHQGWKSDNNQNCFQGRTGTMQQMGNIQMMQQQQMMMQQQQQMVMQQQQQMVMQQQQQMNGMGTGMGTRSNVMGTGMMANNNVDNNMQMNNSSGNGNSKGSMNTLQMNMSSMNDWSSGLNK